MAARKHEYAVHVSEIKETCGRRNFQTPHGFIAQEGKGFGGLSIFAAHAQRFPTKAAARAAAERYTKYPTCYEVSFIKIGI